MKTKALEIRDEATFIPALAVDMNPEPDVYSMSHETQRYLLRRCGYPCDGRPNILLTALDGHGKATNDPYEWEGRTYPVAHNYIIEHWAEINDGDVIDVEFILGEKTTKKISERAASKDNGGSAFPKIADVISNNGDSLTMRQITDGGMSLRDYFAANALQGLLASSAHPIGDEKGNVTFESYSKCSYHHADAMIVERSKP